MTAEPAASSARSHLAVFFAVLGALIAATAAINRLADPFDVLGAVRRPGVNDRLPNTSGFDRMTKPYQLVRQQPRAVILGSSTARSGFLGIEHWNSGLPKPIFNYSLLGANANEVERSLAHAVGEAPIAVAVVVVDFFAYNAYYADNERFATKRLAVAQRKHWLGYQLEDLGALALGIDALKLSLQMLRDSRSASMTNGANTPPSVSQDAAPNAWTTHFRNCERSYIDKWRPPPTRRYSFAAPEREVDRFVSLRQLLKQARKDGPRLILVIPPMHVRLQHALVALDLWPDFVRFKQLLVDEASSKSNVEIWDFAVVNELTVEPVPQDGTGLMRWWHDSAHFTPLYGERILQAILQSKDDGSLGRRLDSNPSELKAYLERSGAALKADTQHHPEVFADVLGNLRTVF